MKNVMKKLCWLSLALVLHAVLAPSWLWAGEVTLFYHNDTVGSPVAITDNAGNVVWKADYEPFGEINQLLDNLATPNTQQFIGKIADPETSLHLLGARYYDGRIGRFLSVDPALRLGLPSVALTRPQLLNAYVYSLNNPYGYADPSGQFPLFAVALGAILAVLNAPTPANAPAPGESLHQSSTLGETFDMVMGAAAGVGAAGGVTGTVVREGAERGAANRATFELYKDELRAQMSRPAVINGELKTLMNELYRETAKVGSGSTAAAVREELRTGQLVGGASHIDKAKGYVKALSNWLKNNPTASSGDRSAAENVIKDLTNALGGK